MLSCYILDTWEPVHAEFSIQIWSGEKERQKWRGTSTKITELFQIQTLRRLASQYRHGLTFKKTDSFTMGSTSGQYTKSFTEIAYKVSFDNDSAT